MIDRPRFKIAAGVVSLMLGLLTGCDSKPADTPGEGGGAGPERAPILAAAVARDPDAIRAQLARGVDINTADVSGWTALHHAAASQHVVVVEVLVARGANLNAVDNAGQTALHVAAWKGHATVITALLNGGANINAVDQEYGLTALQRAEKEGHRDVVELLRSRGGR